MCNITSKYLQCISHHISITESSPRWQRKVHTRKVLKTHPSKGPYSLSKSPTPMSPSRKVPLHPASSDRHLVPMPRLVACLFALLASAAAFAPLAAPLAPREVARSSSLCMGGAPTKPMRVNARNREYNKKYKSEMRTRIKRVRHALPEATHMRPPVEASPDRHCPCCFHHS